MNGSAEAPNKNIKRILQKILDNHRQWQEKLSFTLLSYRTNMRTSTREMSNILVYDAEFVILAEVEIPSLRVIQKAKLDDAEWIRVRQEQLMLIDENRMDAVCHGSTGARKCWDHTGANDEHFSMIIILYPLLNFSGIAEANP
nr:uncharacterized protein LOC117278249 [Nicotiana tomentosiformis]